MSHHALPRRHRVHRQPVHGSHGPRDDGIGDFWLVQIWVFGALFIYEIVLGIALRVSAVGASERARSRVLPPRRRAASSSPTSPRVSSSRSRAWRAPSRSCTSWTRAADAATASTRSWRTRTSSASTRIFRGSSATRSSSPSAGSSVAPSSASARTPRRTTRPWSAAGRRRRRDCAGVHPNRPRLLIRAAWRVMLPRGEDRSATGVPCRTSAGDLSADGRGIVARG